MFKRLFIAGPQAGKVIAIDLKDIEPIPGATILSRSDFTSIDVQKELVQILNSKKVDVVLSDMAPNAGVSKEFDHSSIVKLVLSAFTFSRVVLKEGGTFLCKIWNGREEQRLLNTFSQHFKQTRIVKPKASRDDSAEVFILCRQFSSKKLSADSNAS